MSKKLRGPLLEGFITFLTFVSWVNGLTQICDPPKSKVVHQFSMDICPGGILFAMPVKAGCLRSSSDDDL